MNDMPAPELEQAQPIRATPVMEQFIEIKAANPDSLLFYRMGDFYELFFDDAVDASRALGIVLTKRGKHLGEDIPMCGVPVSRADEYLQKLIALGFRVAVCEQLEDPAEARKRGAKSVVRRDVIRLVTPGTITEEALLDDGRANFLLAIARVKGDGEGGRYGLAWADISSGAFRTLETDQRRLAAEIARIEPREIVLADRLFEDEALKPLWRAQRAAITPLAAALFDGATATDRLARYFEVATIDGFGRFGRAELAAAAGIVAYVEKTQVGRRARLDRPSAEAAASVMLIDAASRANLELTRTTTGESRGSLLAAIDRTVTGPGRRLLADRLAGPSTDLQLIECRLDAVGHLVDDAAAALALADLLRRAPDMTRPLGRLALDRGGPRDLAAIRAGLDAARAVAARLDAGSGLLPAELAEASAALAGAPHDLAALLGRALSDDVPLGRRDGGFIRAGHDPNLDETRALSADGRQLIARLEADYQAETGIRSLRIRHNNVLGYFVDTTPAHAERLAQPPHQGRFIHRQTLANAVRFTTVELGDLESRIASAGDRALALELAHFDDLAARVLAAADPIRAAADALAVIDVAQAMARLAAAENWVRPIVSASLDFHIRGGRHPVVEQALRADGGEAFVANDCDLGPAGGERDGRLIVVTGPNMGGKSTYLRQNALIAVLAQSGAFVPAAEARVGLVDRLFSRVGAADDLARGRSTFMVEMIETAAILNQAGPRALVILDEIGRGTATFDGLSIAWAAIEHLNETNRCRALFATHYHELTALADRLPRIANATVRVREWKGDVVFLHEIVPGAADRSYGIQVARLAGLPEAVIKRARQVLKQLEEHDRKRPVATLIDDLPLFSAARRAPEPPATPALPEGPTRALAELAALAPDDLSPRDALEALYRLKAALAGWRP
jgi:DNA mismatch repair protein MutS